MTGTTAFTALALAAVLAVPAHAAERLVLTSEAGDRDSVLGHAMQDWAKQIEENSDGRLRVDVFYQGELGGQQELFDQLVQGNIQMMITWPQTSYDQRIGVNYIPYMVLGWEDAIASFGPDGWIRKVIGPVYEDLGLKYFGPFPEGFGGIATKGRHATTVEGAQGIRVRSQPIFPLPQTVQAMGFQAVPIDWNEVYTSIQTGVVDGDSSNVIYWDYEYFRDQLDYFVQSSHNFSSYSLLMNEAAWDGLAPEDQAVVAEAAQAVMDAQFANARAEDEKWIAKAQEAGMEYIVPTPAEKAAWVEKVRAEVWPQAEEALGAEIMDQVRANASVPAAE
ncbi:TRAP transporter substrate-binding protein DctP [Poseidonocella sp. HB161398]|uniref:TRAP transporter substrate-binding protein DctP n=1 Tax=Poseidonocella sp. HB161398 TaxID=2320855 RepID=UPI0011088316|nr:TRAP transporter substrate-binding protein DctP [Poseidonocella sp. HB161398]